MGSSVAGRTIFKPGSVVYTGEKARLRNRLFTDAPTVGIPAPEIYAWDGSILEVERVRGISLRSARRYGLLADRAAREALRAFRKSAIQSGFIVDGATQDRILYDGEVWVLVGGSGLRGVTDKRAKRVWNRLCGDF